MQQNTFEPTKPRTPTNAMKFNCLAFSECKFENQNPFQDQPAIKLLFLGNRGGGNKRYRMELPCIFISPENLKR